MAATEVRPVDHPHGSTSVEVLDFRHNTGMDWERFVHSQEQATPFHSMAWLRSLQRTFGYEPRFLYSKCGDEITGVLPLFLISNWLVGRCLISIPFADYGGICAADRISADALTERAKELAILENVDFLELRYRRSWPREEFTPKRLYVAFSGELDPDPNESFRRLPRDTRYMIRKAEKAGLELRTGIEQLPTFYGLLARTWQRFGTPIFAEAWLEVLAEEFRTSIDLKLVYHRERPVAGVLSLRFRDTLFPHYAAASPEANRLAANNFMYWELMKEATAQGLRRFDFGRSKQGTGAYQFKSSWNMKMDVLDYQTFLVNRKNAPDISPLNPWFKKATQVWSRIPYGLTTWLGPRVVAWFP